MQVQSLMGELRSHTRVHACVLRVEKVWARERMRKAPLLAEIALTFRYGLYKERLYLFILIMKIMILFDCIFFGALLPSPCHS